MKFPWLRNRLPEKPTALGSVRLLVSAAMALVLAAVCATNTVRSGQPAAAAAAPTDTSAAPARGNVYE